ncbi:hypothetical protein [Aquimarina muelleri]|uniref:hypothetical protein n=1 Tax=Aquimarina muelleri TaxID=279356 RepID=UPI00040C7952|nr:hypothetical protein [Aquimarina muelleri]MCX2764780.1 hypothetical protein [Aquimarina muelleri]
MFIRRRKACARLDLVSSIAIATVHFYSEVKIKKSVFISAISKLKWYNPNDRSRLDALILQQIKLVGQLED